MPELRIVDDALVNAAQVELDRRALPADAGSAVAQPRPKHLLSGIIRCGVCGAGYVVTSKDRYACASAKERASCGNKVTVRINVIEELVLSTLQTELLTEEHAKLFAAEFNRELRRLRADQQTRKGDLRQRLGDLDTEIANLAANMLGGVVSQTVSRML